MQDRFSIAMVQGGAKIEAKDRVISMATPEPIEFGPMLDELAEKPKKPRRR